MVDGFARRGWVRFPAEPSVADWARNAWAAGQAALHDPAMAHWHRCQGTWFVGVDALPNDAQGRIGDSGPLTGAVVTFIERLWGTLPLLHSGQLSVVWPGYPQPHAGESEAAFRYRHNRDAAHVDGLLAEGPERRRFIREPHGFILGLPLNVAPSGAAPLVVWDGSHKIIRQALAVALEGEDPAHWADTDVTAAYIAARRRVFDSCERVEIAAKPGEAILLDRHILHGIAPWTGTAAPDGRAIAYFRPILSGGVRAWLTGP